MRDTGDMMEDAFSDDTMMECSGDDTHLDHLVNSSDNALNSVTTIRDAAERLLTLLGVENEENDDWLSSEDEGVELDEESDENEEDEDEPRNTKLLHELATSLAEELKHSQKQQGSRAKLSTTHHQRGTRTSHETTREQNDAVQCMEVGLDVCYHQEASKSSKYSHAEPTFSYGTSVSRNFLTSSYQSDDEAMSSGKCSTEARFRAPDETGATKNASSWMIGWDACAAEAVRYLVEDEGLSPHHPTVLAMKSHLEVQRERALARYAV